MTANGKERQKKTISSDLKGDLKGVRMDIVEKFRREIADSSYQVKSFDIAEKIAQRLKEDEDLKMFNKNKLL